MFNYSSSHWNSEAKMRKNNLHIFGSLKSAHTQRINEYDSAAHKLRDTKGKKRRNIYFACKRWTDNIYYSKFRKTRDSDAQLSWWSLPIAKMQNVNGFRLFFVVHFLFFFSTNGNSASGYVYVWIYCMHESASSLHLRPTNRINYDRLLLKPNPMFLFVTRMPGTWFNCFLRFSRGKRKVFLNECKLHFQDE